MTNKSPLELAAQECRRLQAQRLHRQVIATLEAARQDRLNDSLRAFAAAKGAPETHPGQPLKLRLHVI
jgi:hypothetical protein